MPVEQPVIRTALEMPSAIVDLLLCSRESHVKSRNLNVRRPCLALFDSSTVDFSTSV